MTKEELMKRLDEGKIKERVCPYCGCERIYREEYEMYGDTLTVEYSCSACKRMFENNYRLTYLDTVAYDDEDDSVSLW